MTYDFSIVRHLRKKMGLTIYGLSEKCGVSYVALSKLERNLGNPELKTLDKIARALNIETHNLLALAEHDRPQIVDGGHDVSDLGFDIHHVTIGGMHVCLVRGRQGAAGTKAHAHGDDYEICYVLSGKVLLNVKNSTYEVGEGQAVRFDCIFEHYYEMLEDSTFIHVLTAKHGGRDASPWHSVIHPKPVGKPSKR